MLINNPHISPHQQRPKNLKQHQQIVKQKTPNHQRSSLFKTILTHLKKDTHDCPNHLIRQASLSETQYEPVYNVNPPLQQDHNRARHQSQNQNPLELNRQIIHSGRNRNLQTPRVQFNIPHSPIANPVDLTSSTIQSTPQAPTQHNTSNIPSDYLEIRENLFNLPATTDYHPFWLTKAFTRGEPNLVNDPIDAHLTQFCRYQKLLHSLQPLP